MNIKEATKLATPGPLTVHEGGYFGDYLRAHPTKETPGGEIICECKDRPTSELLAHWYNHGPELLEALEAVLTDGIETTTETGIGVLTETSEAAKRAVELIAECEEVEGL